MLLRVLARRTLLPVTATAVLLCGGAVAQAASSVSLCVPSTPNTAVTSASSTGTCGSGSTAVVLPASSAAQQTLISILPDINYQASGIDGKPTIQFSGANVQVINGSGSETTLNGEGNLVIGYPCCGGTETGSHNLLIGSLESDTSYGGIVGGYENTISGPYASVLGGFSNTASGGEATISGGQYNTASGTYSSVSGGTTSTASGSVSSVSGGYKNAASGGYGSVSGGAFNTASGSSSSVSGGYGNTATGGGGSVVGGESNTASGEDSSVVGGANNTESGWYSSLLGGNKLSLMTNYVTCPPLPGTSGCS